MGPTSPWKNLSRVGVREGWDTAEGSERCHSAGSGDRRAQEPSKAGSLLKLNKAGCRVSPSVPRKEHNHVETLALAQ